jgi:septal ring factor EnvC (AmiA/AmiB activator)
VASLNSSVLPSPLLAPSTQLLDDVKALQVDLDASLETQKMNERKIQSLDIMIQEKDREKVVLQQQIDALQQQINDTSNQVRKVKYDTYIYMYIYV